MVVLERGDIGFVMHNDSKLSKAIAWFMKSKFSHSFMILGPYADDTLIIETSDYEVMISTLSRYLNDPSCSLEIYRAKGFASSDGIIARQETFKILKVTYGYFQLLSLGVRRLAMRMGIKIKNFIRLGMVCCAVPIYGHTKCTTSPLFGVDPEGMDTQELNDICKEKMTLVYSRD
jgi:hypothetical protein